MPSEAESAADYRGTVESVTAAGGDRWAVAVRCDDGAVRTYALLPPSGRCLLDRLLARTGARTPAELAGAAVDLFALLAEE